MCDLRYGGFQCFIRKVFFLLCVLLFTACEKSPEQNYRGWPVYGGSPEQIKYSSLTEINPGNIQQLAVAWTFDPGDADESTIFQTTPILVNDKLFVASAKFRIFALNPATGEQLWKFDPYADVIDGKEPLGQSRLRGLMHWAGDKENNARVYGVVRNWLYALDADTGKRILDFGDKGRIDLRVGLDRDPQSISIAASTPGMVFEDLIIMGSTVPESLPSAPGDIRAYDARTGEIRWVFHTIPRPGEFGYDTWPKDAWTYTGGANAWSGFSLDVENELLFFGTGSAAYDFYGGNREGDNLFANSVVALDVRTGERKWHFQTVKHDIWDRDLPAPPSLVSVTRKGRKIPALAQVSKSGHIYVLNRLTGESLFPLEQIEVPGSSLPGEHTSATQMFPTVPLPLARQGLTRDMLNDLSPDMQKEAREVFDELESGGVFVPPSVQGIAFFPGFDGGAEWGGGSWDPETGTFYVNVNEMPWIIKMVEQKPAHNITDASGYYAQYCVACHGEDHQGSPPSFPSVLNLASRYELSQLEDLIKGGAGRMPAFGSVLNDEAVNALGHYLLTGENLDVSSGSPEASFNLFVPYLLKGYDRFLVGERYPAVKPPWGTLNALKLSSGELLWSTRLGEYPELAAAGVPLTGSENYGGSVVTAGGVLFIAATKFDSKIRGFDKLNGKLLWEHALPAPATATPAVYEYQGRQYVVIAAGAAGHTEPGAGSYIAFALPASRAN